MDSGLVLFVSVLVFIISMLVIYFIIKGAVKGALREFGAENRSLKDLEVMQTKLLAEMAKKNGVDSETINKILLPNS